MKKEQTGNKIFQLSAKLLYNVKWVGVAVSALYGISFLECATDGNGISSNDDYIMYTFWISLIITIALFVYNKKWIEFCNRILDRK